MTSLGVTGPHWLNDDIYDYAYKTRLDVHITTTSTYYIFIIKHPDVRTIYILNLTTAIYIVYVFKRTYVSQEPVSILVNQR